MNVRPLHEVPESLVEFNRERVKNEFAQGIYELMRLHKVNRTQLAALLGVQKSLISRMLSGGHNFRIETLADVYLVLGRTPHLVLGTDFEAIRFPVDEAGEEQARTITSIPLPASFPIGNYRDIPSAHQTITSSAIAADARSLAFG
jgi:transcriptional regulator with XRE-family HTH domain